MLNELKKDTKIEQISFGNLIQCKYNLNGEITGFDIKHKLVPLMFINNEYNHKLLKRAIKTVCFLNRLIING